MLPFAVHRMQGRLAAALGSSLRRPVTAYLRDNFYLSTSGDFHTPSLIGALLEVSADRILFAVDYPFEDMGEAARWFDGLPISEVDQAKIGRSNAERLLRL